MVEQLVSTEETEDVTMRPGEPADIRFILNSWKESFRGAPFAKGVRSQTYFYYQGKLLESLLPRCIVRVLCASSRPEQIVGWACVEPTNEVFIIHYVYVKHRYRNQGIARHLLESLHEDYPAPRKEFTSKSFLFWARPPEGREHFHRRVSAAGLEYNPYLLWMRLPEGWED